MAPCSPRGSDFATLYSFTAISDPYTYTNRDGASPFAGLVLSSNTLYGAAVNGGAFGSGTVFGINTDGSGFASLYNFTGGRDGGNPWAGLILSSNTLYGAASQGGSSESGTVFKLNTDGTGFTTLHNFTYGSDGANPLPDLILWSNTLYGTAQQGGNSGSGAVYSGTVFKLNTDGTGFAVLHRFAANSTNSLGFYTNSDGRLFAPDQ